MARCKVCGNELGPEDTRCPQCGTPVEAAAEAVGEEAAAEAGAAGADAAAGADGAADDAVAPEPGSATATASAPEAGPAASNVPPQPPVLSTPAPRQPSPLKRSWMDFKASPGKLPIILKLALFQFVPGVGSLVLNGYAYTWGKEEALGRHLPMPRKIVRPGVLENGLYIYGVTLIATLVSFAVGLLFTIVLDSLRLDALLLPLGIAYIVFASPFFQVMYMRTAICGRVRSGANLKRVWDLFTAPGKVGKAITASWVPSIIVWLLTVVLVVVFCVVFFGLVAASAVSYQVAPINASEAILALAALSALASLLPIILVALFALFFISTAATIIIARAFGYWMQDFEPAMWQEYLEHSKYYTDRAL